MTNEEKAQTLDSLANDYRRDVIFDADEQAALKAGAAALRQQEAVLAPWEDDDVQRVYSILCDNSAPPNPEEHWEGWEARRIAAALRREPQEEVIDAAVTAIYRRFKEWSARKFSADDVTWCEVKAEILKIVRALPAPPEGV